MTEQEKHQQLFVQLISMFHASALQQLGRIKNPLTDGLETDLEQAELSIDMLDMLRSKTVGNSSLEEQKTVSEIVEQLKKNLAEEKLKSETK
ncbi:MAG: DUF1844 domain-containing protein [Bacteroidota bacterium]|jgi:hypothetical protein